MLERIGYEFLCLSKQGQNLKVLKDRGGGGGYQCLQGLSRNTNVSKDRA